MDARVTDRSNSAAQLDALLAKAKQHATSAEQNEATETSARRMKIVDWAKCADELVAAKKLAEADGWKLTNAEIAQTLKWTATRSVEMLLSWRRRNPGDPEVITSGPWDDSRAASEKSAAARYSAARRVVREEERFIADEVLKDPERTRRMIRNLQKGLLAQKPKPAKPTRATPGDSPFRKGGDMIIMEDHLLIIGDSREPLHKVSILLQMGIDPFQPDATGHTAFEKGLDIVVVSDPPYGQDEPGVPGDGSADHRAVYKALKPRGGFSFAAYRPEQLREADDGIRGADGTPIHYLAYQTSGAQGSGPEGRLRNILQTIIYWERKGTRPSWIPGSPSIESVLRADDESIELLKEARKDHPTPKPLNVIEKLIGLVTERGDYVLDPFTGGGSTLIACERTGRKFIGIELDPSYAWRAARRWEDFTGKKAVVSRGGGGYLLLDDLEANPSYGTGFHTTRSQYKPSIEAYRQSRETNTPLVNLLQQLREIPPARHVGDESSPTTM
ncbi:MAG: site-specific DNA-methyltransferase [Planctomycetaceae bacterium]|nr:site-specific DNA-methyltransferase [Planctomycetaceae bacterium]